MRWDGGRLPHRAPFLLVDRVVSATASEVVAEKRLSAADPLLADGLPETLLVEALAQAAGYLLGSGGSQHRGMLAALSGFQFERRASAGETLSLRVRQTGVMGALHRFEGEARVQDRLVARGALVLAIHLEADVGHLP